MWIQTQHKETESDCSITSLVVPGLPIVPIKICTCEVNKIFVYIDTTSASKAYCLITSLVTASLTILAKLRTHASITKLSMYILMKFKNYFIQWKICVDSGTT